MKIKKLSAVEVLLLAGGLAALLVVLVGGTYGVHFLSPLSDSREVWGQFGDFFGGTLNPLLSFFTFIVLLYTVSLQLQTNQENEERHDEQLRDDRFFQFLNLNLAHANGMRVQDEVYGEPKVFEGALANAYVWHDFCEYNLSRVARGDFENRHEGVRQQVRILRRRFWPSLSTYFDSALCVIDFISRYGRDKEFSRFSLSALKAQMTIQSRALLFYVMLYSPDFCKFIPVLMAHGFWDEAVEDPLSEHRGELWKAAAVYHQA